jgi:hypothetical protein
MSITVLLADDSENIRRAIAVLLPAAPDIEIVGEALSFAQTTELASKLHREVIVLDIYMSDEHCVIPAQLKSGAGSTGRCNTSLPVDPTTLPFNHRSARPYSIKTQTRLLICLY